MERATKELPTTFRIAAAELALVDAAAAALGLTRSDFVRQAAANRARQVLESAEPALAGAGPEAP